MTLREALPDGGEHRIAFVLTQDRGGPVDVTVALAAAIDARPGYRVRIFGPRPARGAGEVEHLLEETVVAGKAAAAAVRAARRRIQAWSPSVIHAQDRRAGLVCAGLSWGPARRRRRSVVHTYHGVPDDVTQEWLDDARARPPSRYTRMVLAGDAAVAAAVDRTVVVAPVLRDFLVRRLHVPASRVVHIDNGLALPPARERGPREPGGSRNLLFVGLLVERKGVQLLLDALALGPPDHHLTVVGDGPQREALQARAERLHLSGRVTFLGFRPDVPALLAQADAFVLPSLMEQQPLVLIEAMGAGLPVLATAVGGVPDLVGDAGIVVPAGDPRALADGLARLTSAEGSALGARAARRAHDRFTVDRCVDRHLDLYADLQGWRNGRTDGYLRPDDRSDLARDET